MAIFLPACMLEKPDIADSVSLVRGGTSAGGCKGTLLIVTGEGQPRRSIPNSWAKTYW